MFKRSRSYNNLNLKKQRQTQSYIRAYRQYVWPVGSIVDYRLAPFHILATEGKVHMDQTHLWHMENMQRFCKEDPEFLLATSYRVVDLQDLASMDATIRWWEELTEQGGEGMVVKPMDFVIQKDRGLIQPAIKCRGREYLRMIYGPEYTTKHNLVRLRKRGLKKQCSLAVREFALGLEALIRFVNEEPLRQVHQCCFGILALGSEPVEPRL